MKAYLRGTIGQHLLGFIGGGLCIAGILMVAIVVAFPNEAQPDRLWVAIVPPAAGLLAILLGLSKWREHAGAPGSVTRSLLLGTFFMVIAIAMFGLAYDRVIAPPHTTSSVEAQPRG